MNTVLNLCKRFLLWIKDSDQALFWAWTLGILATTCWVIARWASTPRAAAVEIAVGLAALSVGGILGFLFGMPRAGATGSEAAPAGKGAAASDAASTSKVRPSTNLEQVSDWLTKILIGAGLVELGKLGPTLTTIGSTISRLTPGLEGGEVFPQIVIIVFLVIGFIMSYVWTRLYYTALQAKFDRNLYEDLQHERQARKQADRRAEEVMAGQVVTPAPALPASPDAVTTPDASEPTTLKAAKAIGEVDEAPKQPRNAISVAGQELLKENLPADLRKKIIAFADAEESHLTNPTARPFGNETSVADGYRLRVRIEHQYAQHILFEATVTAPATRPTGRVYFLLHPTYGINRIAQARSTEGGNLSFSAEGYFTLVAIVVSGSAQSTRTVVLAYDLRQVSGVPEWFKNQ